MINYLKKFSDALNKALETGDFEDIKKLSNSFVYVKLYQSLNKELTDSAYFPSLNPEYSEYSYNKPEQYIDESIGDYFKRCDDDFSKFEQEFDKQPPKTDTELNKLREDVINRINDNPRLLVFAEWNKEAIKEITDYDFITLFETALLIGYRVDRNPLMLITDCPSLLDLL